MVFTHALWPVCNKQHMQNKGLFYFEALRTAAHKRNWKLVDQTPSPALNCCAFGWTKTLGDYPPKWPFPDFWPKAGLSTSWKPDVRPSDFNMQSTVHTTSGAKSWLEGANGYWQRLRAKMHGFQRGKWRGLLARRRHAKKGSLGP